MSAALHLPRISTNVRFAASALLFPELAGAWAERLFLTPPRNGGAAAAIDLIDARSALIEHKGRHIATWRWGSRDAPLVVLAHGWGGYAAQMRAFVFPLVSAGFQVVAYDQPAHGVSEGRLTGLPDFAEVLGQVAAYHGGI
jgi:predicted dienelactone hydrolase